MRVQLTDVQKNIYSFLVKFINDNGYPPTIREIQEHFNYNSSNSVVSQLNKIKDKGYITRASSKSGMKARTIRLVDNIIGVHTIESSQLSKAIKEVNEKGYNINLNEAIELLSALDIKLV